MIQEQTTSPTREEREQELNKILSSILTTKELNELNIKPLERTSQIKKGYKHITAKLNKFNHFRTNKELMKYKSDNEFIGLFNNIIDNLLNSNNKNNMSLNNNTKKEENFINKNSY